MTVVPVPSSVLLYSIATGPYLDYFLALLASAEVYLDRSLPTRWVVFTDDTDRLRRLSNPKSTISVDPRRIERQGWPGDTLRRFELMSEAMHEVEVGALCGYLDADTEFASPWRIAHLDMPWRSDIGLVRHPGFYRSGLAIRETLLRPRRSSFDLRRWATEGGKWPGGEWERRPDSYAYVPRRLRRHYVCGGVWFGLRDAFESMVLTLADHVRLDAERGITARWHDESHLNWYAANHSVSLLSPEYCWDASTPPPVGMNPIILAVDKGQTWARD